MRINKELFLLRKLNGVVMVSTGMNENHNTGRRYALNPKKKINGNILNKIANKVKSLFSVNRVVFA